MEPKCDPRGTKIEDKNEDEKRRFRRSSWSRLGSILGRLGCRLGVVEWGFASAKLHFVKNHTVEANKASRGDLDRSWADLEGPRGSKMEAKKVKK